MRSFPPGSRDPLLVSVGSGHASGRGRGRAETGDRDGVKCEDSRASNEGYPKVPEDFTITEKAPLVTRAAFSWLKAPTRTFTFKTLLRH